MVKKTNVNKRDPKVVIIMGGVCTGKTTHRRKNYSKGYSSVDASDIFIELSKSGYYDFPSHLESEMNDIGLDKLKSAIKKRKDIVVEVTGGKFELLKELIEQIKELNYATVVVNLTCSTEEAKRRNNSRGDNNISAYYCEQYHLDWFKQAASEQIS